MLRSVVLITLIWGLGACLAWLFRARLPAGFRSRWIPSAAAVSLIILAERHFARNLFALDHALFYLVIAAAAAVSFVVVPRFYGPMVNIVIAAFLLAAGLAGIYLGEEMKRVAYFALAAVSGFLFFRSLHPGREWKKTLR
jgi:hypothetical protein